MSAGAKKSSGHDELRSPADAVGLSSLTFGYGLPLMRMGAQRQLQAADLPPIRAPDRPEVVVQRMKDAWEAELSRHPRSPSFWRVVFRAFRNQLLAAAVWTFLESACRLVQPLLLRGFLHALTAGQLERLYSCAAGLVLASLAQAVVHHQLYFCSMCTGWNLRIAVTGLLHWKLLRLRTSSLQSSSSADCYNLVSNDVQRFDNGIPFLHFGWSAFLDALVIGALLVLEVGWVATLCGFGVIVLFVAVMIQFGHRFAKKRKITAEITDARMKLTAEMVGAIMSIKIFCWERAFLDRVTAIRKREHASIFSRQLMVAATGAMYYTLAPLSCFVLVITFVAQGLDLSLTLVYTTLSLLLALRLSFGKSFARFIQTVPELHTSMGRFVRFVAQAEVEPRAPIASGASGAPLAVSAASFAWPSGGPRAISDVTCQLQRGQLMVVSGPVGCGKTALLEGLLGELDLQAGSFELQGSLAYAPQAPWIYAGTLRSNVLAGSACDDAWYEKVISACGLKADLAQLGPLGDLTEIGERGVNLSGGQRARVGLARAVYSRPALALLDDPLSAVDPAVAAHLVRMCLRGEVLESSAVLLCTHHESVFPLADVLLLLDENGAVRACGPPQEVAEICSLSFAGHSAESQSSAVDSARPMTASKTTMDLSFASSTQAVGVSLVKAEDKGKGFIGFRTYSYYAKLAGYSLTLLVFSLFLMSQVALLLSNYWLGVWAEAEDQDAPQYVTVFSIVSGATVVFACLRSVLFYGASLRASSSLHHQALQHVLGTHLAFFSANPHGRILNRFSGDLGNVDEQLSQALHEVLDLGFIGAGAVVLVCITVPPAIVLFVVMLMYMVRLRRFVLKSMTELKRIDSSSRSPVFDCFTASLRGLTCIRAFGREDVTQQRMIDLLEDNAKAFFWWLITNRFIGFRLDMQCVLIMAVAAFGGAALRDIISPELLGLAVVHTISLSGLFQFMVRQSALVESFMTSFERLHAYAKLDGESDVGTVQPPAGFPQVGSLEVSGLRMRYREDFPDVLKGVDFVCPGGVKVGICGRTGSGKSSIFMALARLAEWTGGSVTIDGVDAASLPLGTLRRCISWVPQEPNFFSGTLRLNLDPFGRYADDELLEALRSVSMVDAVGAGGLDSVIADQGSNYSVGERQLLSLARALLQRRRILCMDEAFANVDFATDAKVQSAVRAVTEKVGATVLVIAHRMQTLAKSDYIVVMDDGLVAEHGPPQKLLEQGGAYASMVSQAGITSGHD